MNTLDIIILAVLVLGSIMGWRDGFVKSLCSFAGFFVGLVVAFAFYKVVGEAIAPHLGDSAGAAPIIAFLLVWVAVPFGMSFAGSVLTKVFEALQLHAVNSLAGAALGFVKYFLGATLVLYVLAMMQVVTQATINASFFGSMMIAFVDSFMESFRASL